MGPQIEPLLEVLFLLAGGEIGSGFAQSSENLELLLLALGNTGTKLGSHFASCLFPAIDGVLGFLESQALALEAKFSDT